MGATAIEYGLIAAGISVVIIAAESKVLMGGSVCLQSVNELLPNDGDLMRRSRHSFPREFRSR